MGYRDEFYSAANIVGYTGDPANNPTVYFRQGNAFGRITQDHDDPTNIGREQVRAHDDYRIENVPYKGRLHAAEFYAGAYQHVSRGVFTPLTATPDTVNTPIYQAIWTSIARFSDLKPGQQLRVMPITPAS